MHASFDTTGRDASTTLSRSPAFVRLRALLGFDAATCAVLGTLLVTTNAAMARVTGLPSGLLVDCGWLLLAFGAVVAGTAMRRTTSRVAVLAIVDANVAWALASIAFGVFGADGATPLGRTAIVAQGVAVAVLAIAEFALWRRAFRRAPVADLRR